MEYLNYKVFKNDLIQRRVFENLYFLLSLKNTLLYWVYLGCLLGNEGNYPWQNCSKDTAHFK